MKKIVKGKYVDGAIRLLDDIRLDGNVDIYVIIEEREEDNIIEESFGIWIDSDDYVERLRDESETRMKELGIN
ncbi:MAG: DUF104 domain-containing protein [Nitrospirae bacterium]|nr:DUF104 domain-containing protein [Nitrospirota bacterium]